MEAFAALPGMVLVGMGGAVASCCNVGVIGAVAGFTGATATPKSSRNIRVAALAFMFGTIVSLTILGSVTGVIGARVGSSVGYGWALAGGLMMITFGVIALGWLPVKMPASVSGLGNRIAGSSGRLGPATFGLAMGGVQSACSTACLCNPAMALALALALQGDAIWGATVMGAYAVGFSLPLVAALTGLQFGLGKLAEKSQAWISRIRKVSGFALIAVGFYMLVTI